MSRYHFTVTDHEGTFIAGFLNKAAFDVFYDANRNAFNDGNLTAVDHGDPFLA